MVDISPGHSLTECFNNFLKFSSGIMQNMEHEWLRLASFSNFPNCSISAVRLSQAGFYYTGKGDEVECFRCGLKHNMWRENDIPCEVHKSLSPNCSFLTRHSETASNGNQVDYASGGNGHYALASSSKANLADDSTKGDFGTSLYSHGPIMSPSEVTKNRTVSGTHVGQNNEVETQTQSSSNSSVSAGSITQNGWHADDVLNLPPPCQTSGRHESHTNQRFNTETNTRRDHDSGKKVTRTGNSKCSEMMEPLGISFDKPVHRQYAIVTVRLNSFKMWPRHLSQTPQELSKAGFFYEGTGDKVYCFFCGGGLFNWDPGDDPWEEHARWFPKCVFLRQSKGDEFVMKVQMEKEGAAMVTNPGEHNRGHEKNKPNQNGFHVDNKESITFSHPAVVSVMEMGCKPSIVKQALEVVNSQEQTDLTAEILLLKIWDIEGNPTGTCSDDADTPVQTDTNQGENENLPPKPSHSVTDDDAERRAILEENRQLRELQTCKICLDEDVSIVFLPCGHMSACSSCAPALRKCPICRTFIKGTVKAIIS